MSKNSSKRGYGTHNISRLKLSRKYINSITKKEWSDVTSMDLYNLYLKGWTSEKILKKFNITITQLMNRLRLV